MFMKKIIFRYLFSRRGLKQKINEGFILIWKKVMTTVYLSFQDITTNFPHVSVMVFCVKPLHVLLPFILTAVINDTIGAAKI